MKGLQTAAAQMARGREKDKDTVLLMDRYAVYAISLTMGACVPGPNEATVGDMGTGNRAVVLAYECRT